MCKCGCNTCETKGPLLTEGKVKSLLSEGLQYHINKKIPLFETVYRIGSDKHLSLIKEARKMYSRNVIDLCEEDEALIKTHLGEFALYEGESVPLDLPMLEAEIDYEKEKTWKIQDKFPIEVTARKGWSGNYYTIEPKPMDISYDAFIDLGSGENVDYTSYDYTTGEAQWTSDSLEQIKQWEEDNQDKIKVIYPKSLNESKIPTQDQVDKFFALTQNETHYLNSKPVAGQEGTLNNTEIEPWDEYDLSNWNSLVRKAKSKGQLNEGRAIITFKNDYEVEMNTGEGYDDDFEYFEAGEREQVYILDKNDKRVHVEFGDGTNAFIPSDVISVQEKSLNEDNKISDDKLMRLIPKMPKGYVGKNTGIGKYTISTPDGEDIFLTQSKDKKNWFYEPSNITLKILNEDKKYNQEELLRLDLIAHRRFGCDYKNCTDEQKAEVLKDKVKVGVKEALQELKKYKIKEDYYTPDQDQKDDEEDYGVGYDDEGLPLGEAEFKGKDVPLNKPKRGGSKAYYVYVRDPKTKKIKKVSFGSGGLRAKIKNKEARNAFAARHNCKNKKDRTKAGYWSCNLPRYAKVLGLGANMNTFW